MSAATAAPARASRREASVRVKICGVTRTEDALLAAELGAELVGLNFYRPSPRYLTPEAAGDLVRAVRPAHPELRWVGVFVDASAAHIAQVAAVAGLDLVQLHGDEGPDDMAALAGLAPGLLARTIKVFRVRPGLRHDEIRQDLGRRMEPWRALGVWGFLVDTHHPDLYGGTGESWDFGSLGGLAHGGDGDIRLLLAGGLAPGNLQAALDARPWGIDLCSGVESEPGRKDPHLLRRLFEEIHHATFRSAT